LDAEADPAGADIEDLSQDGHALGGLDAEADPAGADIEDLNDHRGADEEPLPYLPRQYHHFDLLSRGGHRRLGLGEEAAEPSEVRRPDGDLLRRGPDDRAGLRRLPA